MQEVRSSNLLSSTGEEKADRANRAYKEELSNKDGRTEENGASENRIEKRGRRQLREIQRLAPEHN